jgi:hypothetical protein
VRVLRADGEVEIRGDEMWEEGVRVWNALRDVDVGEKARL